MKKIYFMFFLIFGLCMFLHLIGQQVEKNEAAFQRPVQDSPSLGQSVPFTLTTPLEAPAQSAARVPSAVTTTMAQRGDRVLIGEEVEKFQDSRVPLSMQNSIHPYWEKKLASELQRFMPEGTKANFSKKRSLIKIKRGQGIYLEEVLVTYAMPSGEVSRFNAEIDPQTGRITSTWNRTIVEQGQNEKKKLYEASGTIP